MLMVILLLMTVMLEMGGVGGHGTLLDPPQRSGIWRDVDDDGEKRFPGAPRNENDHQLFCGGFAVQYESNGGKCGVCGDAFNESHPRPNEAGGRYGQGIIVRRYSQGDVINVTVVITANHLGYFVFKLCPNNNVSQEVKQECLDKHKLKVLQQKANGRLTVSDRYPIYHGMYNEKQISLQLPSDVTCSQCVLQWTYVTGHFWGCDPDGSCGLGHGNQENFVNCADIAITATAGINHKRVRTTSDVNELQSRPADSRLTTSKPDEATTATTVKTTAAPTGGCRSAGEYSGKPRMDEWCREQCAVGYCPPTHCTCSR